MKILPCQQKLNLIAQFQCLVCAHLGLKLPAFVTLTPLSVVKALQGGGFPMTQPTLPRYVRSQPASLDAPLCVCQCLYVLNRLDFLPQTGNSMNCQLSLRGLNLFQWSLPKYGHVVLIFQFQISLQINVHVVMATASTVMQNL